MTPDDLGVRHAFATVNGIRMHYVEKGEGPLVVMLHGFPEMWWCWRYQIEALSAAGYRVVAPDLRGYNETDPTGPYDIDTLRDDVVALLDHLGAAKATFIAHDWGGAVAWHLASTRQDRCARLAVLNCPHPAVFAKALRTKFSQLKRSWYMFYFQIPFLPELQLTARRGKAVIAITRSLAIDRTHFNDAELAPYAAAIIKPGRASAMIGWYRASIRAGLRGGRSGPKTLRSYEKIRIPTLLLWALEDKALGYDDIVPGTERFVPDIEIQTIPHCGHFLQQEQPREVNRRLLEFLARTASAAEGASPAKGGRPDPGALRPS
jgi:pimeloyl-ACP methyl ester carboxylesterase